MKERVPQLADTLNINLKKYNRELVDFFIFGNNSYLVNNTMQIADLIIFTNKFSVKDRQSYIDEYIALYSSKGQFGTPFKWTYPSKKKGSKIQIKGFTNN